MALKKADLAGLLSGERAWCDERITVGFEFKFELRDFSNKFHFILRHVFWTKKNDFVMVSSGDFVMVEWLARRLKVTAAVFSVVVGDDKLQF